MAQAAPCSRVSNTCIGHLGPTCTLFYSHLLCYLHQAACGSSVVPPVTTSLVRGNARDGGRTKAIRTHVGVEWRWDQLDRCPSPSDCLTKGYLVWGPTTRSISPETAAETSPSPIPPLGLRVASHYAHFLAELFLGLSLTSTANQAHSDKALKSTA